jgi:hypothetical protein
MRVKLLYSALLVSLLAASVVVPTAAGQSTPAPYYNNSTTDVPNETWMDGREDATLDNTTHYLTRVVSFVIGGGVGAQGGGAAGPLVAGLSVFGVVLGVVARGRTGSVGGGVMAIVAAAALVSAGFAPTWMYAVVVIALGLVLAGVFIRNA